MTNDSTLEAGPAEGQEPENTSLRDELAKALAEAETIDEAPEPDEPASPEEQTSDAKIVEEVVEETPEAPKEESLEAPDHWPAEKREKFSALPNEAKAIVLERHKEMERDYTQKTMETSETRKKFEAVNTLLEPYRDEMQKMGLDEVGAVRALLDNYRDTSPMLNALKSNPAEAIKRMAAHYGVDLNATATEAEYVDPMVSSLKAEVEGVKKQLTTHEKQAQDRIVAEYQKQIDAVAEEKDEQGNPVRPHFDAVIPAMEALMKSGQAKDWAGAYDAAVWAVPQYRDEMLKAQADKKAKQDAEAAQEKVKKAKKASKSMAPKGKATTSEPVSLRDELSAQYNKAMKAG